jgi:hypothetical protein
VSRFTTAANAVIAQVEEAARENHKPAPRAPARKQKVAAAGGGGAARSEGGEGGWEEF